MRTTTALAVVTSMIDQAQRQLLACRHKADKLNINQHLDSYFGTRFSTTAKQKLPCGCPARLQTTDHTHTFSTLRMQRDTLLSCLTNAMRKIRL